MRGVTFIDVVVGTALVVIIFMALVGVLRASLLVSSTAKAKAAATSLAENEMEYIRGLTYDNVGTVGGIPAGVIPQTQTQVLDGASYTERVLIEYVDDPADGSAGSDANGITIDYKVVKVSVSYTLRGVTNTISLVSNFAPPGIESTNGGGTLQINVVNASGAAVPGATVTIVNASTSPAVNFTTFSNSSGIVYLPGAATSTQYQITATKAGYSTAQTYARAGANQNPNPGYLTIVKNQTTTGTFAIDTFSTLNVSTLLASTTGSSTPLGGVFLTFTGAKTIGSTGAGAPIPKTTAVITTDSLGNGALSLEWDSYTPTVTTYDIEDSCGLSPYALSPGSSTSVSLTLGTKTTNSIVVEVIDGSGNPVSSATVLLSKTGFSSVSHSSSCGNAYFGGVSAATYSVAVGQSGHSTSTYSGVAVSGASTYVATLH